MASVMEIMQLCRLCLVKDEVNIPIFEEKGDLREIFLKISACLPVKVAREDNLPKNICDGCSYKLELLYEFWNTSANSEKQLLKWLSQVGVKKASTSDKVASVKMQPHSINSDNVVLKQEVVDLGDSHGSDDELDADDLNVSNDAQDYILQQQQLPYQPVTFEFQQEGFTEGEATSSTAGPSATITSEAAPKRKRRAAAMKALPPHIDSEEEDEDDVDMVETKIAKTEEQSDDSASEDPEPTTFVGLPSTSTDNEQPGPSGVGKGAAEAPFMEHHYSSDSFEVVTEENQIEEEQKRKHLKCAECSKVFENMTKFKAHIRNHRIKTFACNICDKKFTFQYQVAMHKQSSHSTERGFICDICSASFTSQAYLRSHERIHSRAHKFKCDGCDRGFYNKNAYNHHYQVHHKGVRYQCEVCEKIFKDEYYYKKHVISHDPNFVKTQYTCKICDKVLQHFRTYVNHMKTHKGENQHICEICGKIVGWAQSLKDHMLIHKGEKPFICETCGKRFTKKQALVVHERIHTKSKPYICNLCEKRFTQRSSLKVHIRYHTGERPYQCAICQKRFLTRSLMKTHLNTHVTPPPK